ncbi:serine acetyltransferase, partial [Burkholderia gladioli]|nr:serine acetyltransferase [Burkholderia gladioli]
MSKSSASSLTRGWGLEQIVAELRESRETLHRTRHPRGIR